MVTGDSAVGSGCNTRTGPCQLAPTVGGQGGRKPKIAALANAIKHTVSLTVWGTHGPTVVRLEEPNHPVHIMMRVGFVMGMLETATGRIFAAFLPQEVAMAALKSRA